MSSSKLGTAASGGLAMARKAGLPSAAAFTCTNWPALEYAFTISSVALRVIACSELATFCTSLQHNEATSASSSPPSS